MSEQNQMRSVMIILAAMVLVIAGTVALFMINAGDDEFSSEHIGGDFVLQSSSGDVSLQQFRGQAVLLFFGYTHCPDVCPTIMSSVAETMSLLSEAEQSRVQPLFITVDPERDSVEHLGKYVRFFHPKIIGLSGSEGDIKKVAEKYSVQFFRDDLADAGIENYLMNHTSYLFLINPEGEVVDMMSDHTSPVDIAKTLRQQIPSLGNSE